MHGTNMKKKMVCIFTIVLSSFNF